MESRKSLDERRQHLLRAAEQLFCRRGYDSTSVRDIADQAKSHTAVFYRCFNDKAEVYDQLLRKRVASIWGQVTSSCDNAAPMEVLSEVIRAWFHGMANDEFLCALQAHPVGVGERNHTLPFLNALSHFVAMIESLHQGDPEATAQTRAQLGVVISAIAGWCLWQSQLSSWFDRDAVVEALVGMVRDHTRAFGNALRKVCISSSVSSRVAADALD